MRKQTSQQKRERCWIEEVWQRSEPAQSIRKERTSTQHCNMQPAFIAWWRNGEIEELQPKPKDKWTHCDQEVEGKKHRAEWCAAANKCLKRFVEHFQKRMLEEELCLKKKGT